jgi:hypothetical protein
MRMLLLNFGHPLSEMQQVEIKTFTNTPIDEIRTIPVQIDQSKPLIPQVGAIVDAAQLSREEWRTRALLINPPGYAPAAFVRKVYCSLKPCDAPTKTVECLVPCIGAS